MGTSSADPEDLDLFARRSAEADDALRAAFGRVLRDYEEFAAGTSWAALDADGLMNGFARLLGLNERDVAWSRTVAAAFRRAGRGGRTSLPDAALDASLRAAGLAGDRADLTVDLPEAYGSQPTSGYADDPVNTASGNFLEVETDVVRSGLQAGLTFARTYNSRDLAVGVFGRGWSSWADARLVDRPDGAHLVRPDGQRVVVPRAGGGYARVPALAGTVEPADDGLAVVLLGGERWEFDAAGLPVRTWSGTGTEVRFQAEHGRITALVHEAGRAVRLEHDGDRVVALVGPDGTRTAYAYDDAGRLVGASRGPAGPRTYRYDDAGLLAAVVDADDVVEVDNLYDAQGRVVQQVAPSGRVSTYTYLPGRVTVVQDEAGEAPNTWIADAAGRLVGVVDAHGARQSTSYDAAGDPVLLTDRRGGVTAQEFDARRRLVRHVSPRGAEVRTTYDALDRVVETVVAGRRTALRYRGDERTPSEVVDPEGGRTLLDVRDGLVRSLTDPDGVTTRLGYDADGLVVAVTTADGRTTRLERDDAGRVTATVTPSGRRTEQRYDDAGDLVERVGPDGAVWRFEHTAAGRLRAVVDPTGARQEQEHGPDGQVVATTDALGRTTTRTYDDAGNVSGVVQPDGARWRFVHDGLSRLVQVVDPTGASWLQEHDAAGAVVAQVDPLGTRWTTDVDVEGLVRSRGGADERLVLERDALGQVVAEQGPDGARVEVERDGCGRIVAVRDAEGGLTRWTLSPAGRVASVVLPSGRTQTYEHDAVGRVAAVVDGLGGRTALRHDEDGRLVTRTFPDGREEHRTYDAAGRPASLSHPDTGLSTWRYDAAGRLVETTDAAHGRRRFVHDAAGQLVEAHDGDGGRTRYERDLAGRVVRVVDPSGAVSERRYDALGRVVTVVEPTGLTTTGVYDAAGRLREQVDGAGRRLRWEYDAAGRLRAVADADGELLRVDRDLPARTLRVSDPAGTSTLRWDACGRLVERRRGDASLAWRYDADGLRTALVHPDGRETGYERDAAGRVVRVAHPALGEVRLERDPAGRPVAADADGLAVRWIRDGDGTTQTTRVGGTVRSSRVQRDDAGRVAVLVRDGSTLRCAHDASGRLVSVDADGTVTRYAYDACGRLVRETTGDRTTAYRYDAAGRLEQVEHPDGTVVRVEHDGAGRRTREHGGGLDRRYGWDALGSLRSVDTGAGPVALEVDGLGELVRAGGTDLLWDTADPASPLLHAGGADLLEPGRAWAAASSGAGPAGAGPVGAAAWTAPDLRGTAAPGLDPWGAAAAPGVPELPGGLSLGLHGELQVEGLLWLRARAYDPASRAFLSPDPLPPVTGAGWSGHPWSYAGDDPLGSSDPSGLRPVTDAELDAFRADMGRNVLDRNREVVLGGVLVVAGGVLIATGVGGPAGVMLVMAGGDIVLQKTVTGQVDYRQTLVSGALGGAGAALSTAGYGVRAVATGGAAVGTAYSSATYTLTTEDWSVRGALGASAGGAASGALGALAGPTSGSVAPALGGWLRTASFQTISRSQGTTIASHTTRVVVNGSAGASGTILSKGVDPSEEVTKGQVFKGFLVGAAAGHGGDWLQGRAGHSSPGIGTLRGANGGPWSPDEVLVPSLLGGGVEVVLGNLVDAGGKSFSEDT